ncbi:MAG: orotate phosphoribosyltransferase [Nitrososphaeria archaeon]|jgi:orotate phosphoribosyltransferase
MYGLETKLWAEKKSVLGKELAAILVRLGALRFGNFVLTSGRTSPYYIDLRLLPSYPGVLERIADMYVAVMENEMEIGGLKVAGIPTAGLPLATAVSLRAKLPLIYVRETPKLHGEMKMIEGILSKGDAVVLIDDLATTGGSLLKAAEAVRMSGGRVEHAVVLIDREEGGFENLAKAGVKLHAVSRISELLSWLEVVGGIPADQVGVIREYLSARRSGENAR